MPTDEEWAAHAERITDPSRPMPTGSHIATGAKAAAEGRAILVREFGSEDALDAFMRRAGRARRGETPKGASPTVRGRLPEADFAAFKRLEHSTGRSQSELLREAVRLLLAKNRLEH